MAMAQLISSQCKLIDDDDDDDDRYPLRKLGIKANTHLADPTTRTSTVP
jgi:hypothetical protein